MQPANDDMTKITRKAIPIRRNKDFLSQECSPPKNESGPLAKAGLVALQTKMH
jgi:hypothetical protein